MNAAGGVEAPEKAVDPLSVLIRKAVREAIVELRDDVIKVAPRILSLEQCATYLGRTPAAIRMLVHDGKLPVLRMDSRLQFDVRDLDHLIEQLHKVAS